MTATRVITEADDGATIEIHVGESATLALSENPTTGYRWEIAPQQRTVVEIRDRPYKSQSNAIGGGGEASWTLRAVEPGETTLSAKLWRQWEGDGSIVKRFTARVKVSPR